MKKFFAVGYKWTVGDATRYGHTVVTAESQEDAEAKLGRLGKHYTVVPIAQWQRERDAAMAQRKNKTPSS